MLIRGDRLNDRQREQVLNAFVYRWTTGNNLLETAYAGRQRPTMPLQTDEQWLRAHAFHFTKDGRRLMLSRRYAEAAFMADVE